MSKCKYALNEKVYINIFIGVVKLHDMPYFQKQDVIHMHEKQI